jgi:hypothetical protein
MTQPFVTASGLRIGCPDIQRETAEQFKAINGFNDADVEALSRYCRKETDTWEGRLR